MISTNALLNLLSLVRRTGLEILVSLLSVLVTCSVALLPTQESASILHKDRVAALKAMLAPKTLSALLRAIAALLAKIRKPVPLQIA